MFRALRVACLCVAASVVISSAAQAQAPLHPLDPLSRQEHFAVLEILQQAGKLTDATRFTRLEVKAPDKATVWAWKPGSPLSRSAEVVISQGPAVFEATVDITGKKLVSWTERKGVQPMWLESEFGADVVEKAMKDPRFAEALKKRGITNAQFVTCIAVPPGNFGEPKYAGKRLGVLSLPPAIRLSQYLGAPDRGPRRGDGHAREGDSRVHRRRTGACRAWRQRLRPRRDRPLARIGSAAARSGSQPAPATR